VKVTGTNVERRKKEICRNIFIVRTGHRKIKWMETEEKMDNPVTDNPCWKYDTQAKPSFCFLLYLSNKCTIHTVL